MKRAWPELKPFLAPAIIVVIYLVVRALYGAISKSDGLLTPSGSVDMTRAALGLVTLVLRVFVLIVVPWVVVYRLIMRLLRTWIGS